MITQGEKAKDELTPGLIREAYEKLFGGGRRGVRRFTRSGLRHVSLPGDAVLVEQNPKKRTEWAEAKGGRRVARAVSDGHYVARVVDGEVERLG